jgi:hypothetical protein
MFARLSAKFLLLVAAAALVFFGVGLLGLALAETLVAHLGAAGAYALTGGVMLLVVLAGFGVSAMVRPRRPPPPPPQNFATLLMGALAKDVPWAAVASAGVLKLVDVFLKRQRAKNPN